MTVDDIIKIDDIYYSALTGKKYNRERSQKERSLIKKFLQQLSYYYNGLESLGANFFIDYFDFQYNYRFSQQTWTGGAVMLNWIVGEKALDLWYNRYIIDPHWSYHNRKGFNNSIHVDKRKIFKIFKQDIEEDLSSLIENKERERFYNQDRGLLYCYEKTSLYDDKNRLCNECLFKHDCKKLLKATNFELYISRGYYVKDRKMQQVSAE